MEFNYQPILLWLGIMFLYICSRIMWRKILDGQVLRMTTNEIMEHEEYLRIYKMIANPFLGLLLLGLIFFTGYSVSTGENVDTGQETVERQAEEFKMPTAEEIKKLNSAAISREEVEREKQLKIEKEKSKKEYKEFIENSNSN